jgi:hypothetical protein
MKMKHYALSLAYALTLVLFGPLAASAEQLFSLTIAAPKEPLKAGAEVHLLVTVTNTSNRDISFITSPGPIPEDGLLYQIHVRDAQGRSLPPSADLRTRDKRVPINYGSRLARTLKPGESFVDQVTVSRFYDLSRPGEYTISVARPMPPRQNLGKGSVKSNAVTVTVTQ